MPVLAVLAIAAAAAVNLVGNRLVERSAMITAAVKIGGIAALAIAGILATGVGSLSRLVDAGTALRRITGGPDSWPPWR